MEERLQRYLRDLEPLVDHDCGTFNVEGVRQNAEYLEKRFGELGFEFVRYDVGDEVGPLLIGFNGNPEQFDILFSGHMDTVFPDGTVKELPMRIEGDRIYGAGVQDMKCGFVNLLQAMEAVGKEELSKLDIALCFSPDEEISSRFSREKMKEIAKGAKAAMVMEASPALENVIEARKSIASFEIRVFGKSGHASRPAEGASAIKALAEIILRLYTLQDMKRGISVNVGVIEGGIGQNTIAPEASLIFEMRHLTLADYEESEREFYAITSDDYGENIRVEAKLRSFKPPMEKLPGSERYQSIVSEAANELGIEIEYTTGAGGSDGNWIASAGVPVLDALGGVGKGAHSRSEYIEIEPTLRRIDLMEKILRKLIQEEGE